MQTKTIRPAALGAALAAAVLALAACAGSPGGTATTTASASPTTASPSATPTPTTPASVPPPTSEKDALDQSLAAIQEYDRILTAAVNSKSGDASALKTVASAQALDFGTQVIQQAAKSPVTYTGDPTVSLVSGFSGDLTANGKVYPHGTAQLKVCEDSSKVVGTNPDGSKAKGSDTPRVIGGYWTEYDPAHSRWLVTKTFQDGTSAC